MDIGEFNSLSPAAAATTATVWADVPGWVNAIVAGRPYRSVDALASYARDLAEVWSPADLDSALAHHPRIGEKLKGAGAEASASQAEQASMASAASDVTRALADGNRAYEERFGRVFLIRAAGRTPANMLSELHRRILLDDASEVREALVQLADIALLRLTTTIDTDNALPEEQE